jgi:hypothetical protein
VVISDQRIINLEVEQLADAAAAGVGHGTAGGEGGEHAAVPTRAAGQPARRFQEQFSAGRLDGRHGPLAEDHQVRDGQSEPLVPGEEFQRLGMRGRAGHQVQRHMRLVPPGRGQDLLDVDLEQRPAGQGADRVHPLGMVEAQAGALPARYQNGAHLAGVEGLAAAGQGLGPRAGKRGQN